MGEGGRIKKSPTHQIAAVHLLSSDERQTACKPGSVPALAGDGWPFVWDVRCRTPRATYPKGDAETHPRPEAAGLSYSVLLPVGFTLPRPSPGARCALTAPFHPYRQTSRCVGGLLSVALSLGSPPPDVIRHRVSVEPGLSSLQSRAVIQPSGSWMSYSQSHKASSLRFSSNNTCNMDRFR